MSRGESRETFSELGPGTGRWARAAVVVALLVLVPLVAFYPYLRDWRSLTDLDMVLHYGMLLSAYRSVVEYGQLPYWNPFLGGGHPNLFFPETFVAAPHLLLSYVDPLLGIKVGLLVSMSLGLWGAYVLAGLRLREPVLRALFAITYALSGFHLAKIAGGMLWALAAMGIPWAVWCFVRTTQTTLFRYRLGFAAVCLWMLLGGGVYYLLYTGLIVAIFLIVNARALTKQIGLAVLETALLTLGLCSVKLLPSLAVMAGSRRAVDTGEGGYSLLGLWYALISERVNRFDMASMFPDESFGWLHGFSRDFDENSAYLSYVGLLLVVIGLLRPAPDRPQENGAPTLSNRVLYVLLAFSLYAALGQHLGAISFGDLIGHVPVLSAMRVPQRALVIAVLVVPFFVCFGLDFACARLAPRFRRPAAIAVLFLQLALLVHFNDVLYERSYHFDVPDVQPVTDFKHVRVGEGDNPYRVLAAGRATSQLAPSFGLGSRALHPGNRSYRGEYFFVDGGPLPRLVSWTTNEIVLEMPPAPAARSGGRLLAVNQFYERSWRARDDSGAELEVAPIERAPGSWADDLIGVRTRPGTSSVTLRYEPKLATLGMVVFLVTCLGAALRGFTTLRRRSGGSRDRSV